MKKGFTLVEIIISIGLIVIIGTISIFSFNLIKKNNKEKTLESMSETIYNAVNVYLESNSELKDELYKNKNGLKIPLTTLENSGLVDFGKLSDDLDEEDFVVTMLGSTDPDDDTCANTYTAKSWNIKDGETIYICEKSDGTSNLVQVAGDADNLSKATRERYYFEGDNSSLNYVKYKEEVYRILYVDKDDSLVIYKNDWFTIDDYNITGVSSFGELENYAAPIFGVVNCFLYGSNDASSGYRFIEHGYFYNYFINESLTITKIKEGSLYLPEEIVNGSVFLTLNDRYKFSNLAFPTSIVRRSDNSTIINTKKIRLKPCIKITTGTGDIADPFVLKNNCSTT